MPLANPSHPVADAQARVRALLAALRQSQATAETAAAVTSILRAHAAEAYAATDADHRDAEARRRVAECLERELATASTAAAEAIALAVAARAQTAVANTAAARAAASSQIAATRAVETAASLASVRALMSAFEPAGSRSELLGLKSLTAANEAARLAEELAFHAMDISAEAAQQGFGLSVSAAEENQRKLDALLAAARTEQATNSAAWDAARVARAAGRAEFHARDRAAKQSEDDRRAARSAVERTERVLNRGMTAALETVAAMRDRRATIPGIVAHCVWPAELARTAHEVRCFAVPEEDAASFDLEAARACAETARAVATARAGRTHTRFAALITSDSRTRPLEPGKTYVVFALRLPLDPSRPEPGPPEADDLTLPTGVATVMLPSAKIDSRTPARSAVAAAKKVSLPFSDAIRQKLRWRWHLERESTESRRRQAEALAVSEVAAARLSGAQQKFEMAVARRDAAQRESDATNAAAREFTVRLPAVAELVERADRLAKALDRALDRAQEVWEFARTAERTSGELSDYLAKRKASNALVSVDLIAAAQRAFAQTLTAWEAILAATEDIARALAAQAAALAAARRMVDRDSRLRPLLTPPARSSRLAAARSWASLATALERGNFALADVRAALFALAESDHAVRRAAFDRAAVEANEAEARLDGASVAAQSAAAALVAADAAINVRA